MIKSGIDQDAIIQMFSQATAKQGEGLRKAVTEATVKALQGRELTMENIRKVLKSVTQASSAGAALNPAGPADIEAMLLNTMGAKKMIWAPGIKGADITDYHIDALARFVKPGQILIQMGEEVDPDDPWSVSAFETHDILAAARDANDRPLDLVILPEPYDIRVDAPDFVSSYVNYYVCNGAVIAAEFGDPEADREAARILAKLYPGREVVTLNIDPVGEVGGGIHCATHEQPKV